MGYSRKEYWSAVSFSRESSQTQGWNFHLLHILHWQAYSLPPVLHHLGSSYVCGLLKVKLLSDLALGIGVLRASTDEESP